jgi:hypothetical protein
MNYKRASVVELVPRIYYLKAHTLFLIGEAHKGVRFLMRQSLCTPEASIKLCSPKTHVKTRVETANKVCWKFDKCFTQDIGAMNGGALSDPSFIGSFKRHPKIKEATQKNAKRLIQKTSNENRGNPEKCKGTRSKDLWWKKGNPEKHEGAHSKDLRWKERQPQKTQRGSFKRPPMKKEATQKKHKGAHSKLMKKRQPQKTQRGSFKRPPKEKEAIIAKV